MPFLKQIIVSDLFYRYLIFVLSLPQCEKSLSFSFSYNSNDVAQLRQVLDAVKLDFAPFIETVPLVDIVEMGYFRAEVDRDSYARLVVKC